MGSVMLRFKSSLVTVTMFLLSLFLQAGNDALVETAEAVLALARSHQEEKGSLPSVDLSEFTDEEAGIAQSTYIEREVNRDVFTTMLVETERDEFLKVAEKAQNLLKKWIEVEKALASGKSDQTKDERDTVNKYNDEKKGKHLSVGGKPSLKLSSRLKSIKVKKDGKDAGKNAKTNTGRKPLGITPPKLNLKSSKKVDGKKDDKKDKDNKSKLKAPGKFKLKTPGQFKLKLKKPVKVTKKEGGGKALGQDKNGDKNEGKDKDKGKKEVGKDKKETKKKGATSSDNKGKTGDKDKKGDKDSKKSSKVRLRLRGLRRKGKK